jgi:uncharacterized Zn finger protein
MMTTVANIDVQAAGGIEAARLERCLGLEVERTGRGRYLVTGGTEPHWVDLHSRLVPRCDCGDHLWRERVCKHILAAMLHEGDERVIREVGGLVRALRELVLSHEKPRRRRRSRAADADEVAEAA